MRRNTHHLGEREGKLLSAVVETDEKIVKVSVMEKNKRDEKSKWRRGQLRRRAKEELQAAGLVGDNRRSMALEKKIASMCHSSRICCRNKVQ